MIAKCSRDFCVARLDAVLGGDFDLTGEAQRQRLIAVASDRLKLNQLEA